MTMPLELVTIPCLRDNYAFLIRDSETGATALVDAPEAAPIQSALAARGWTLGQIFLTHHHDDHVAGVAALVAATGARVIGAQADAHRLPPLDRAIAEGDRVEVGAAHGRVIDVSGHTLGHLAYLFDGLAFTGDSLMAGGCGRLFEGTPDQMWASLQKLASLPADTLICSGHEYTAANLRFAATLEPQNPALILRKDAVDRARAANLPSVPSRLAEELATNPFLRAAQPAIRTALGLQDAAGPVAFAALRALKDRF
jgi:hydroxyacylglutathione hydrolase